MASIVKRKTKYSVVYSYEDENGKRRQKWESFDTNAEAKKRKIEVEHQQENGTFVVPNAKTVSDLLKEYTDVYGVNNWSLSTYNSQVSLMNNYIIPLIGDVSLDEVTPRMIDKFYTSLGKVKTVQSKYNKRKSEFVAPYTIHKIHKLLRSAFNQGVKWELIARNPCLNPTLPKAETQKREIWTVETLLHALEVCEDDTLSLAINISFSCSLRMGEMLALTWDCIDISEEAVANNSCSLWVNKEEQRVKKSVMSELNQKDVIMTFPENDISNKTVLVLKAPKTKSSIRKVFIPSTVVKMLQQKKKQIEEMKEIYGAEYNDFNLVFCHPNGKPVENSVIRNALNKLIKEHDLPKVVFHSFRHASITYKLKWNGGDMKSVQGDSGHAQLDMIADVYSHIIDEDRRYNAQKFEEQFYQTKGIRTEEGTTVPTPNFEDIVEKEKTAAYGEKLEKEENEKDTSKEPSDIETLAKLLSNPETAALLKALAKQL